MALAESLMYSGLSALFSVLCWLIRWAWKRWRKKKKRAAVQPGGDAEGGAAGGGDKLTEEVRDIPFTICGRLMKGVGESAIDSYAEGESRRCRCYCCCRPRCLC